MHEGPERSCKGSVLGKATLACPQACPHVTAMAGDLGTSSHKDLVEHIPASSWAGTTFISCLCPYHRLQPKRNNCKCFPTQAVSPGSAGGV